MPNPFPGMNPYLEQFWGDVHHRLITYACDQLQGDLPGDLRARMQERVFVESPQDKERSIYPDVRIVERGRGRREKAAVEPKSAVATAEPLSIRVINDPISQGYIEILDQATGRKVVTVIEVLSPHNKVLGKGGRLYKRKQKECLSGGVNLVEIDLIRDGRWVLSVEPDLVQESHRIATYKICIYRAAERLWKFYRAPLRERLPAINIPLRPSDNDIQLDLQALIEQCYDKGAYDDDIDYNKHTIPLLSKEDEFWADELLRKQRRRATPTPASPVKRKRKKT